MFNKKIPLSPYQKFCAGYNDRATKNNSYFTGFVLATAKTNLQFNHSGSWTLDSINAFDLAEVDNTNLGQINMINVSSFCGPQGLVWGYDYPVMDKRKLSKIKNLKFKKKTVPVYSARPLLEATNKLFGTRDHKRFPLMPGSHVPCAGKDIKKIGPESIYSAFGRYQRRSGIGQYFGIIDTHFFDVDIFIPRFCSDPETT